MHAPQSSFQSNSGTTTQTLVCLPKLYRPNPLCPAMPILPHPEFPRYRPIGRSSRFQSCLGIDAADPNPCRRNQTYRLATNNDATNDSFNLPPSTRLCLRPPTTRSTLYVCYMFDNAHDQPYRSRHSIPRR